jgi:predicted GNAT family N-acyltransferase
VPASRTRAMPDECIFAVDASSPFMSAVFSLRHEVFVREQAVPPELERDEFDATAIHLVALRGDQVIGTLRIVVKGCEARIGRMAVRAPDRNAGIGSRLMDHAGEVARTMGVAALVLHAQLGARSFYARLGYCEAGDMFEEAGIPHVIMRKSVRNHR